MTGIEMDTKDLDSFGQKLTRYLPRFLRYNTIDDEAAGQELLELVRQFASGHPGPEVRSGRYLASIKRDGTRVFSAAPQSARLEKGYTGRDSLGRDYHQPPFPHFGPAGQIMRKNYGIRKRTIIAKAWETK